MSEHLIQRFLRDDPGVPAVLRGRLSGGEDPVLGMMTYTLEGIDAAYRSIGWLWADQLIDEHADVYGAHLYVPAPDHMPSPRAHVASLVRGYVTAMDAGRVDAVEVADAFAATLGFFADGADGAYDTDMMVREMTLWTLPREFAGESFGARMLPHLRAILVWQRLVWLAECRAADGVVLADGEAIAWPEDPLDRLRWLWALTAAQPELRRSPPLARVVLDGRMPRVIHDAEDVATLAGMLPPPAAGVVDHAVSEATELLVAAEPGSTMRAELGGLWGIDQVVVAAEEPVSAGTWRLAFALEHSTGWLAGELYCGASGQWLVESCQLAGADDAISRGAADALALLVLDTWLGLGPGRTLPA